MFFQDNTNHITNDLYISSLEYTAWEKFTNGFSNKFTIYINDQIILKNISILTLNTKDGNIKRIFRFPKIDDYKDVTYYYFKNVGIIKHDIIESILMVPLGSVNELIPLNNNQFSNVLGGLPSNDNKLAKIIVKTFHNMNPNTKIITIPYICLACI